MQNDWEIKGRGHVCSITERPFEEGEVFHTLLYRDGDGFRREDLCEEAWTQRNENIAPFSHWRSKYVPPIPPPPDALPKENAEALLRRLVEEKNPAHANASYILALMLERKRILKPLESPDEDTLLYEHGPTGDTFIIPNPRLSLDQIEDVQREVSDLLIEAVRANG